MAIDVTAYDEAIDASGCWCCCCCTCRFHLVLLIKRKTLVICTQFSQLSKPRRFSSAHHSLLVYSFKRYVEKCEKSCIDRNVEKCLLIRAAIYNLIHKRYWFDSVSFKSVVASVFYTKTLFKIELYLANIILLEKWIEFRCWLAYRRFIRFCEKKSQPHHSNRSCFEY